MTNKLLCACGKCHECKKEELKTLQDSKRKGNLTSEDISETRTIMGGGCPEYQKEEDLK